MPFIHQALLYQSLMVAQTLSYLTVNLSANHRSWCNTGQSRLPVSLHSLSHFQKAFRYIISFDSSNSTNRSHKIDDIFSLNTKSHNRVLTLLLNSEASSSRHCNSHLQNSFELFPFPVSLVVLCP